MDVNHTDIAIEASEKPDRRQRPARRWMRVGLRCLFYPIFGIALLCLGAFVYLQTDSGQARAKGYLRQALENRSAGRLHIGKITGDLFFSFSLEDIRLSTPRGPVLEADRISISYISPLLLKKMLWIREIGINGCRLELIRDPQGLWNVSELFADSGDQPQTVQKAPPVNIILDRLVVDRSSVALIEKRHGGTSVHRAKDIRLQATLRPWPTIAATILNLSFQSSDPRLPAADMAGAVSYDAASRRISADRLRIKTAQSEVSFSGAVALDSPTPRLDVSADIHALSPTELARWLPGVTPSPDILTGFLAVKGTPERMDHRLALQLGPLSFETSGKLSRSEGQGIGIDMSGTIRHFNPAALPFDNLPDIQGDINFDMTVDMTLPDFDRLLADAGDISGNLGFHIHPSSLSGYRLTGGLVRAEWIDRKALIHRAEFSNEAGTVLVNGRVAPFDRTCRLRINAQNDLAALSRIVSGMVPQLKSFPEIGGQIISNGELSGWRDGISVSATVEGTGIGDSRIHAEGLTLNGNWQVMPKTFSGTFELDLKNVQINQNTFSMVRTEAGIDPETAKLHVNATLDTGQTVRLSGRIGQWLTPQKKLVVDTLNVTANETVLTNREPIEVTLSPESVQINACRLASQQAELSVSGRLDKNHAQALNLSVRNLEIDWLSTFWPKIKGIRGRLSADVSMGGTLSAPVIKAAISIEEPAGYHFSLSKIEGNAAYAHSHFQLTGTAYKNNRPLMGIKGDMRAALSLMPFGFDTLPDGLSADITFDEMHLAALPIPKFRGVDFDGMLYGSISLSGGLTAPLIDGDISLKNGWLSFRRPDLTYENVSGSFRFSKDTVRISQIDIKGDREGVLRCSGTAVFDGLRPIQFDLEFTGENFFIPYGRAIRAKVTPDLKLHGSPSSPGLTGNLTVVEARVHVDRIADQGPAEIHVVDREIINGNEFNLSENQPEGLSFLTPLSTDVTITVPKDAWIKGQGLNVEIQGRIDLKKASGGPFLMTGDLNAVRGQYKFQGKRFTISEGHVSFIGLEEPNPNLDIQAVYPIDDVEIIAKLSGTARNFNLSLESNPQMDQADIISYLAFGRPTGSARGQQEFNAEKAALSITGALSESELDDIFHEALGIDTLEIDTSGGEISKGSAAFGKYVRPNVFVLYRQGFDLYEVHQMEVTYEINQNFSLEALIGDEESAGIDLTWEYDF